MSAGGKRKRENGISTSRKKTSIHAKQQQAQKVRASAVGGDDLKWQSVPIPKRLDDAEGFFGLEELSDVEVVKDENSKGVLFKAASEKLGPSKELLLDKSAVEEWSGFEEESETSHEIGDPPTKTVDRPRLTDVVTDTSKGYADDSELLEGVAFSEWTGEAPEPETDMSSWNTLMLSEPLQYALSALKFSAPTQIQLSAIPHAFAGRDVIGKAVTGSGKTLAFGIPIIQQWLEIRNTSSGKNSYSGPMALILAPTRELAHQISKHLSAVCNGLDVGPRVVTVTGGLSVLKQQRQLESANIVVATPGRLWEVVSESNDLLERIKTIRYLVIDEADRLLSEGHFREVEDLLDALDRETIDEDADEGETDHKNSRPSRQILVFSATFHKGLQQKLDAKQKKHRTGESNLLSDKQSMEYLMHKLPFQKEQKPVFVDANPESKLAENLSETVLECKAMEKDLYLYAFLLQEQHKRKKLLTDLSTRILVFTNSIHAVKRLSSLLQTLDIPSTTVSPLHSNMPQKSRLRSLERFSGATSNSATKTTTNILVATDVAARGLDIKDITHIIHYHVPRTADTYVHRSGRTARINASGSSTLLCSPDETGAVTKLIAKIHTSSSASHSLKDITKSLGRIYLANTLLRQTQPRIDLAQKLVDAQQSTEKVKSEDNWLRNAAEDLGVEYDSDEFEQASKQGRRGRGGEKDRRAKKAAKEEGTREKIGLWRGRLREELGRKLDFGDGSGGGGRSGRFVAGGGVDVDKLLRQREAELKR